MLTAADVAGAVAAAGFSHLVWLPDSHLGAWEPALLALQTPRLIRVTREGEAVGLAAGLLLGGAAPLVAMQCTGFFEAGDAVRNAVHDLRLPLKLLVGVRSWQAHRHGTTADNCPRFAEPVVRAWGLPVAWVDPAVATPADCRQALRGLAEASGPAVALWGE